MPTYTVHAPAGRLSAQQKEQLARGITNAHNQFTGAQTFFAQVMFVDVAQDNWFIGGGPIGGSQIFLHGQIRACRSEEVKQGLLRALVDVVSEITEESRQKIWGYLVELPPTQMVEFGHVLPMPGSEGQWLSALPEEDREYMKSCGG
jgi:phenylpyruvate tautomerase PptA (4-oxalocrotonate tautomerase family)